MMYLGLSEAENGRNLCSLRQSQVLGALEPGGGTDRKLTENSIGKLLISGVLLFVGNILCGQSTKICSLCTLVFILPL